MSSRKKLVMEALDEGLNMDVMGSDYSFASGAPDIMPEYMVEGIVRLFKERGYDVSDIAVKHNYNAWRCDMKSGFRDESRGTFLFSPCGCNRLRFHASHLCDECRDWQKTYQC